MEQIQNMEITLTSTKLGTKEQLVLFVLYLYI